ncbi:MAG: tRNA/rRNA methyltransferase (SpoU) [candidate division WS6 bacterium GW2011_GWF2_39_15]|uniref:tRNA/rRNA methyltransferase (SpoU) n=1 Tax=candidate division WS6 bacterium GW2011_GWF2_39_15 TaxID=1619100 RepID=A0A0G0QX24_9BACT|nr:MAG: tRNA/rRNA methyltransferase (SpoU) [candidate division WS6 bacterium GW2011_GWF2_39_15]
MKIYVILDNIRSAYNVGSIFRTADGAGDCEILLCGISPTPEHIKVFKTALGSTNSVPWKYFKTTQEAVQFIKDKKVPLYSIELTDRAKVYHQLTFPQDLAIVLGHETEGVNRHILEQSNEHIFVPMNGKKESLNVATVAGIVIYEIVKNKK